MRGIPDDFYPPDLEPIPTMTELAASGLVTILERMKDGTPLTVRIKPEGQQRLNEVMARNAERCRAWRNGESHEG